MYHTIKFDTDITVDSEISPKHWLERVHIKRGVPLRAQLKPYVMETKDGPVEVADLYFEDGTVTRHVPFQCFSFVE